MIWGPAHQFLYKIFIRIEVIREYLLFLSFLRCQGRSETVPISRSQQDQSARS